MVDNTLIHRKITKLSQHEKNNLSQNFEFSLQFKTNKIRQVTNLNNI